MVASSRLTGGTSVRKTYAEQNAERARLQGINFNEGQVPVMKGAALETVIPSPRRVETAPDVSEYEARVNEEVNARDINPAQVESIRQSGTPLGSVVGTQQAVGVGADEQTIYKPVEESTVVKQMDRLSLPEGAKEAALDLNYMYETNPKFSKIHIPQNQESKVESLLDSMYQYTDEALVNNPMFAGALSKLPTVNLDQYSKVAVLANANVLHTQESYVKGRMTGQADDRFSLVDAEETPVVSRESQLGMNASEYGRAATGALKRILTVGGVDISALTEEDFTIMGGALLEHAIESGQISSTKVDGEVVYVPRGAHAGSILGTQSNALIGNDLKQNVQDTAPQAGIGTQKGKALPGLGGRKSAAVKPTDQPTTDLTKDIQSNMPYMVDMDNTSIIFLEWMDVIDNIVVPQEGSMQLVHSTSPFAEVFKMDLGTATAAYKRKVYQLSTSNEPDIEQVAKITRTVNKITNTRMTEVYTSLNKQLDLIKRGKADPDGLFFYTFGNSDINGRIYNNTHNGNYTLDKVGARQSQKAKINPYLTIKKEGWVGRNASINVAARKLLEVEGNPKQFNKIINGLSPDVEAEISFRIALVKTLLKDAKHAKKNAGLGKSTNADARALTMAEASGLMNRSNHSNKELYAAYERLSVEDPIALMRHYGNQGAAIREAIDGMNKSIRDLPVIEFDPNATAQERKAQAAEAWGDISTKDSSALAQFANQRGELRQQTSIRDNALKYIRAYDGDVSAPNRFELDFEIELDATQSGPFLQALIAPSGSARDVMDSLGLEMNTTKGDLRDFAKGLLLDGKGTVVEEAFVGDPEQAEAWQGFVRSIFDSDRSSYARELMLKQPIMQFYYGKPAHMFSDVSAELLGWFDQEIQLDPRLSGMAPQDRVAAVQNIIGTMLTNDRFDANYATVMKNLGKWLAITDSDLVLDGPMGKINLTMESLAQILNDDETINERVTPASLRLNIVELFDTQTNTPLKFQVMKKSRTTASPKTKSQYDPTRPISGDNIKTMPGKKLADALGVLIIHQLDNAVMNHTVNTVNMNRPRNNPLPAKIIYDAIIPNAAGYLRYSHAYNNESLPLAQKWDLPKALNKLRAKAQEKFLKETKGMESFNISVLEGRDGHLHGVERFAVITGWLDDYATRQPRRQDYPPGTGGNRMFKLDESKSKTAVMEEAMMVAKNAGYIPPELAESYYTQGFVEQDEVFVLNAEERSNMHIKRDAFLSLIRKFQNKHTATFQEWESTVYANKVPINTGMGHLG